MVDDSGIMHTLVGSQRPRATWRPLPCSGAILASEVQLNWPTDMAVNPLDGSLHFIDDGLVLRLTNDGRVQVVAGRPLHCAPPGDNTKGFPPQQTSSALLEPQSLSFSDQGELYIAESDAKRINRVRKIANNKIESVAGMASNCNCLDPGCRCYDPASYLAASTRFASISSIAVSPDGRLYVADQGNLRIRTVASYMPTREDEEVFEVPDPDSQELYVFNRFGQHILTKDLLTQALKHSMEYSQTTSTGKLVSITDFDGRKLVVLRDYSQQVTALQTSDGQKHAVKVNRMGYLESFTSPQGYQAHFTYASSTGLLQSKLDSQNYGHIFKYDQYGRLIESVSPTGEITFLTFNLTSHGGNIKVGQTVVSVNDNKVTETSLAGRGETRQTTVLPDKSLRVEAGDTVVTLASITHSVIQHSHPIIGDSYPMIGGLSVEAGGNLISKVDWEYSIQTSGHDTQLLGVNKKLRVNGENLLFVSYDKLQRREVLYLPDKTELLEIKYDEYSRPTAWVTPTAVWAPVSQKYDRFGHLEEWRKGNIFEKYSYDKNGRLLEVSDGKGALLTYEYKDRDPMPFKVKTGNGASYLVDYDRQAGAVRSVTTPRGHIHSWLTQPDIESIRWNYVAPWSARPYTLFFNDQGAIQSIRYPGNDRISFHYTQSGELQSVFAGQTEIEFGRGGGGGGGGGEAESKFIESIFLNQGGGGGGFESREKRKYHNGWLKEQRIRFIGGSNPFENAFIKYQMDGTGRPSKVIFSSGSKREHSAPELSWSYDQNTGALTAVDSFQITNLAFNTTQLEDAELRKVCRRDGYGNFESITYYSRGQQIFGLSYEYNTEGALIHASVTDEDGRQRKESYSYNENRQLDKSWGIVNFDFNYDENGNMIMVSRDGERDVVIYGPGDRVETHGTKKIVYDTNGFVTAINEQRFLFNGLGSLVSYVGQRGLRVEYFYDSAGRLTGWTDSKGDHCQYFYSNPLQPAQVTFVMPKNGPTQRLSYDTNGHLVKIESQEEKLYIVCDKLGSPLLVVRAGGTIVKHIRYSPFGAVLEDSNPSLFIPLGFRGQISSKHADFLMGGETNRVYSTAILQWLNPDWQSFLRRPVNTPFDLFIYRFNNNNPLTTTTTTTTTTAKPSYMTSMNDWTRIFGFDVERIFHAADPLGLMKPEPFHQVLLDSLLPSQRLVSETESLVDNAVRDLKHLSFVGCQPAVDRRVSLLPRLTSRPQNFGQGFLLSVLRESQENLAVVNPIPVQNSVVQKIFESVLNNSVYLDASFSDSSKTVYYFVKPNINKFSLDADTVRRLAGEFTVSHKAEIDNGKELSIVNDRFEVRVLYGSGPGLYQAALLKTFTSLANSRAWAHEKELVARGFGTAGWSQSEIAELLRTGAVRGYEAVEIQPVDKYPGLALDPTNREFVKFGRARKNRHSRRKHAQD